jgi:hypothetical protein
MLTHNLPLALILGQLVDVNDGQRSTSGGASDSEQNDCTVNPTGPSSSLPVTIVTPDGNWPSACLNRSQSIVSKSGIESSPFLALVGERSRRYSPLPSYRM